MENRGRQFNEVDDFNRMMAELEFYVNDEDPKKMPEHIVVNNEVACRTCGRAK